MPGVEIGVGRRTHYNHAVKSPPTRGEQPWHALLPLAQLYGMLVVNVLSTFIGTIGNILVIVTVHTNCTLQIISNFWLMSLAVPDLLVTALGQPVFVVFLGLQIGGECNAILS